MVESDESGTVSMGPRPGGHGKNSMNYLSLALVAFQWGHDPEVMVRRQVDCIYNWYYSVSMGPRPGGHGK